ncbi:MAG TPA: phosphonate ABC transporter, permease protein PhnE [Streptosporangiaceae bacterium]|jgi:phosphonate transport system permease protein|nr:phosphonate ABC transporter, permease protein PhnE [Streptosporangiaceae bacterium]
MSVTLNTTPPRRLPVPPRQRTVRSLLTTIVVLAVVVGLHIVAFRETQFSLPELASGWHGIWSFLFGDQRTAGALPPDLHWKIVGPALGQCVVTFSMGLLGTTLSIPLALLLALLGAKTTSRNVVVYQLARALMSFFRAVPSFIWGLIFVTAVGLGAFPGVLAIITHNMGVMGKLWSEAMEETDRGPIEALRTAGASSAQTATHAVLPSVIPQFTGLFLYRVDVNVRDSLTLGVIGAGGIGFYITQAIQEFQFNVMMTYVLMVLVMVIALDLLSGWLRGRIPQ